MASPYASVVVPTFNRLDRLKRVLAALDGQTVPRGAFEVIVVSDGSTDGTDDYLRSIAPGGRVRPLFQANSGPAAARNAGIRAAAGTLIVFLDDDVVPAPGCLSAHVQAHAEASRDVAVIGPLLTPNDFKLSPWVDWEQRMLMKQYDAMTKGEWKASPRQFYTGNASVRRELLLSTGGFDEQFRRAEDVELAYRLAARGVGFIFSMAPAGYHYAERSFSSWLGTAYAYGRNDAIFARDRNQDWLVHAVREEFNCRKRSLRMLVAACLRSPALANACVVTMRGVATASGWIVGAGKLERAVYSALYSLRYYQGFLEEIGEADVLFRPVPQGVA